MTSSETVAGIVLAAGLSTRMGRNKMLLEIAGEAIVHRAARRACEAGLTPVLLVVGHQVDQAVRAVSDLPVRLVTNPEYRGTRSTSLQAGVRDLPAGTQAVVTMLADMVMVDEHLLRRVVDIGARQDVVAAACRYGDVVAPPMFFRREVFGDLLEWTGEGAGKGVLTMHGSRTTLITAPPEMLGDIDTPEQYRAAEAVLRRSIKPGPEAASP